MTDVIDLKKAQLEMRVRRGYRNWTSKFGEDFTSSTRLPHISNNTLAFLSCGREKGSFYLYDLIMNLQGLGSGFEFNELDTKDKMSVIDRYLFLLDRIRFEYIKRLGWLESYPGEEFTLVELIIQFDQLAPGLQAKPPSLSKDHPDYSKFRSMNSFERKELIRKLIPEALKEIQDHSTTL
ncbi:MAG: hypothetical protein JRC68_03345 [Deltaproteobacteria bacterium]|nr:hypothetical protein [Deltaproteobacteria bacterium]